MTIKKLAILLTASVLISPAIYSTANESNILHTAVEDVALDKIGDNVVVTDQWLRVSAKGNTAAYMFITNNSNIDVMLIGVDAGSLVQKSEIHNTITEKDGVVKMFSVDSMIIPAYQTVEFKPKSKHLMLMGQKEAIVEGKSYNLGLLFKAADKNGGEFKINVACVARKR